MPSISCDKCHTDEPGRYIEWGDGCLCEICYDKEHDV